jgi:hypothetical protein
MIPNALPADMSACFQVLAACVAATAPSPAGAPDARRCSSSRALPHLRDMRTATPPRSREKPAHPPPLANAWIAVSRVVRRDYPPQKDETILLRKGMGPKVNPANETYFFSTTITGHGVLNLVFKPNQIDDRMPVINELSNVLLSAAEVDGDGVPFQGGASVEVLNTFCSGDPAGSGSVHVRLNVLWNSALKIRLAFALWP